MGLVPEPLALPRTKRRRWVEEVVQTSAMDCGPAALASLLRSHGVPASYAKLRELCQTDVDGTSIDTIETAARGLGLDAEQIMVPLDHLLLPEAACLPALVVVRQPGGGAHFVAVWSTVLGAVQIMDPAVGRRWRSVSRFADEVFIHQQRVPADAFRAWAESVEFRAALSARMARIGVSAKTGGRLMELAIAEPGWRSPAALDAAIRETTTLVRARVLTRGTPATAFIRALYARGLETGGTEQTADGACWAVRAHPGTAERELILRGAVLIRVRGLTRSTGVDHAQLAESPSVFAGGWSAKVLEESRQSVAGALLRLTFPSGGGAASALILAAGVLSCAAVGEGLLFRELLELGRGTAFGRPEATVVALALFAAMLLLVEIPMERAVYRLGRGLELRARLALLERLPRTVEGYLASLPSSDLAERSHTLHGLRLLPPYALRFLSIVLEALGLGIAVVWLAPAAGPFVLSIVVCAAVVPLAAWPALSERDMRVRAHTGGLARFDLDALLGLLPLRAHGGGRAIRHQHQELLVHWARAQLDRARVSVFSSSVQLALVMGLAVVLVHRLASVGANPGPFLLIAFWVLRLPPLTERATVFIQDFPARRNAVLRALELLRAPAHRTPGAPTVGCNDSEGEGRHRGLGIRAVEAEVRVGGRPVLKDVSFEIPSGTHVAIVGPSGAGKTTLLGVLLGWHRLASGQVLLDGRELTNEDIVSVRRATAWVDTTVRLWNRSLIENVRYGNPNADSRGIAAALSEAELNDLTNLLPEGLRTVLGEAGARLSGGEGQRARLGRALLRESVRLVLLDEALRGLEPDRRLRLTRTIRRHWHAATVLAVTHDLTEALEFDRVIVLERGRLVEFDAPTVLARDPNSRFARMLAAEDRVLERLLGSKRWKPLTLVDGRLFPSPGDSA